MSKTPSKKEKILQIKEVKKTRDYSAEPFVKEKKRRAIEHLKKNPIPEEILKQMGVTKPFKFEDFD